MPAYPAYLAAPGADADVEPDDPEADTDIEQEFGVAVDRDAVAANAADDIDA